MANAKKCDRCGVFYTENSNDKGIAYIKAVNSLNCFNIYDVCDMCVDSFFNWVNEGKLKMSEKESVENVVSEEM